MWGLIRLTHNLVNKNDSVALVFCFVSQRNASSVPMKFLRTEEASLDNIFQSLTEVQLPFCFYKLP